MTFYPFWGFYSEQSSPVIKSSLKHINLCTYSTFILFVSLWSLLWLPASCPSLAQGTHSVCPRGFLARTQAPLPLRATKIWGGRSFWDSLAFCSSSSPTTVLPARLLKMVTLQVSDPPQIPVQLQLQRWTFKSTIFCILWEGKEDLCPQQTWALTGKDIEKILQIYNVTS